VEKELTGILNRIVDRIINTAHPSRIILFGSAAAGTMSVKSDFDLLVIVKNNVHRLIY
jgi:predicted nucleotidyltransferase